VCSDTSRGKREEVRIMALRFRLHELKKTRLLRALVRLPALVGAAAAPVIAYGAVTGGTTPQADGSVEGGATRTAPGGEGRLVSLDLERKTMRVTADRSLLRDTLDLGGAAANVTPNTPDNTHGAENTVTTPNTPDNTHGAENTVTTPNTPDNTHGAENTGAADSPSSTSISVQGGQSSGGSSQGDDRSGGDGEDGHED
jgi:hypothetical protein